MPSRELPHLRTPPVEASDRSTGLRPLTDAEPSAALGAGRSGEYPSVRPATGPITEDRLTPTEPLATAGRPLPSLQRTTSTTAPPPPESPRPRILSNPALERPYSSLAPPSRRGTDPTAAPESPASTQPRSATDPARPRSEPPPSMRRTHSAGPQRRLGTCQLHRVALSPTGDCVFCKREAERHARARWSNITLLIVLAVAVTVGVVLAR
jgi:hypothetical protein